MRIDLDELARLDALAHQARDLVGQRGAAYAGAPTASGVPHKKTLAELLRARDGGDPPPARTIQSDGANVLRTRMGAV